MTFTVLKTSEEVNQRLTSWTKIEPFVPSSVLSSGIGAPNSDLWRTEFGGGKLQKEATQPSTELWWNAELWGCGGVLTWPQVLHSPLQSVGLQSQLRRDKARTQRTPHPLPNAAGLHNAPSTQVRSRGVCETIPGDAALSACVEWMMTN